MKNIWLKFGCFLTGYNYNLMRVSSEVSVKTLKRYTSALIIICTIWAFVGYTFTDRYLKAGVIGSFFGAIIMCVIIVQIERQIILSVHKNNFLYFFRGVIATMMALIGTIIIDQILFKEDIEQAKILYLNDKVDQILPARAFELKRQISEVDSTIRNKEADANDLNAEISARPQIRLVSSQKTVIPIERKVMDTLSGEEKIVPENKISTTTNITYEPNPKIGVLAQVNQQISDLRHLKNQKDSMLVQLRPIIETEIYSKVGFLDELNIMFKLLGNSTIAIIVWAIWFLFLFGLELFILVSKINEKENDYEATVKHQMDLQLKKLALLASSK